MAKQYLYYEHRDCFGENIVAEDSFHSFNSKKGALAYATNKMREYLEAKDEDGSAKYELYDPRRFYAKEYREIGCQVLFTGVGADHSVFSLVVTEIVAEDDTPDMPAEDDGKHTVYFWYHGGMSREDIETAEYAIQCGDFDAFCKLREKYPPCDDGFENFPDNITVFDEKSDIVGYLPVMEKENFLKINSEEHENG